MDRRQFVLGSSASYLRGASPPFRLVDVTKQSRIRFIHNSGAFGRKYLPRDAGPGCAFLDFDNDGWQDILIVNGTDWPEDLETPHYSVPL